MKNSPVYVQKVRTPSPKVHVHVQSEESEIEDFPSSDVEKNNDGPAERSPLESIEFESIDSIESQSIKLIKSIIEYSQIELETVITSASGCVSPILLSPLKNTPLDSSKKRKKRRRDHQPRNAR